MEEFEKAQQPARDALLQTISHCSIDWTQKCRSCALIRMHSSKCSKNSSTSRRSFNFGQTNKHEAFMRKKTVKGPVGELQTFIEALQSLILPCTSQKKYSAAVNRQSLKYTTILAIRRRTRRTRVLQHPATPTLQRWPTLSTMSIALQNAATPTLRNMSDCMEDDE